MKSHHMLLTALAALAIGGFAGYQICKKKYNIA